jgi:melibiose permease/lactose/raffinose/galactose permease
MGNRKLDKRTKWSYCVGATGRDMAYTLVSMFLLTYIQYTMKLTVAQFATSSAIVVVCLLWDAVNDPLMGIIIENARLKSGKFKPWILLGVILNALVIIGLFTIRPEGWGFVAFFGIGYLLWGMTYTMNDISYWGLLPALSSDAKERNALVTIQGIFICIGQFSVAGLLPDMIAGNAVKAYRIAAIVIASCFLCFQLLTFFGVKEPPRQDNKEVLSLKDMFKIFLRNDQLVAIGIACLLFQIGNNLLIMIGMNFFYFEFGYSVGGNLVFWFTVMYGLGTLVSEAGFASIAAKFSRAKIIAVSTAMTVAGYLLFLSVGYILPKNSILINAVGFMIFFAQGLFNMTMIVMLNNTIEYDQVRFGERHDSIISAVRSFATKLASAIDQGVVALILIISGIYAISQNISNLEIQSGTGEITKEAAIAGADSFIATATGVQRFILRMGIASVPIIAIGIAFLIIKKKYIIDEKKYKELVDEIDKRLHN